VPPLPVPTALAVIAPELWRLAGLTAPAVRLTVPPLLLVPTPVSVIAPVASAAPEVRVTVAPGAVSAPTDIPLPTVEPPV